MKTGLFGVNEIRLEQWSMHCVQLNQKGIGSIDLSVIRDFYVISSDHIICFTLFLELHFQMFTFYFTGIHKQYNCYFTYYLLAHKLCILHGLKR